MTQKDISNCICRFCRQEKNSKQIDTRKLDLHIVLDALAAAARGQKLDPETCQLIERIARESNHKDFTADDVEALYRCGWQPQPMPPAYIVNAAGTINPADLTFGSFLHANRQRQKDWPSENWTIEQWMVALTGELGEAANILKKMFRGDLSPEEGKIALGKELADVQTYLTITADKAGIDLPAVTIAKFNEVSDRVGSDVKIPLPVTDQSSQLPEKLPCDVTIGAATFRRGVDTQLVLEKISWWQEMADKGNPPPENRPPNYDCNCTVKARYSGHRIDCDVPQRKGDE